MTELLIKMPEELHRHIKNDNVYYLEDGEELYTIVKNGISLPEERGKLIDYRLVIEAIDDWVNTGEYKYTNATYYLRKRIANISPIIEADNKFYKES